MRFLILAALLVAGCIGKPCQALCTDDADCPAGDICYQHIACLQACSGAICGGQCVDRFHNCTACGAACAQGQVCAGSGCAAACDSGLANCSGSCIDVKGDRFNCGACGHGCASNEWCNAGTCEALPSCG